jgi:hypothetical protein
VLLLREPLVAPVRAHLGVDEVLVDRGELRGEHVVQDFDHRRITAHRPPPGSRSPQAYRRLASAPADLKLKVDVAAS